MMQFVHQTTSVVGTSNRNRRTPDEIIVVLNARQSYKRGVAYS